jgi:hypothetical protein
MIFIFAASSLQKLLSAQFFGLSYDFFHRGDYPTGIASHNRSFLRTDYHPPTLNIDRQGLQRSDGSALTFSVNHFIAELITTIA